MFVATLVVSVLLAALLTASALGKWRHDPGQMETMRRVGFPEHRVGLLATAEAAGAVGLLSGLFWWPLGVAAAAGVVAYFLGALGAHVRVRDSALGPAAALFAAGAVALVLRLLSR